MFKLKRRLDEVERREDKRWQREKRERDEQEWKGRVEREIRQDLARRPRKKLEFKVARTVEAVTHA